MLEQIREAEISQSIDRVRAIFNPRRIIVLTSIVLDITVDRALSWKELKAWFALERWFPKVLPLTASATAEAIGSKRSAERLLPSIVKTANSQIDIIWKVAVYRMEGQKRPSTVLYRANLSAPQAAIEEALGEPLVSFEVQLGPDVAEFVEPPPSAETARQPVGIVPNDMVVPLSPDVPTDESFPRTIGTKMPANEDSPPPASSLIDPQPLALEEMAPENEAMPEPTNDNEADRRETPDEVYRRKVAEMDEMEWLDTDMAGVEAARRWREELHFLSAKTPSDAPASTIDSPIAATP